ncbi:MAG: NAD(P)/FAD-dependent oxidoreductase [Gemmataceae bacterium]
MSHGNLPRVAILGAGPIGLEAALQSATLKLPFVVYERGKIGEHLRQWGHVRLFSPFGANSSPLGRERLRADRPQHEVPGDRDILTGRQHVESYLDPLGQSPLLREHIRIETTVVRIGRRGFLKEESPGEARRGQQPFLLLLRHDKREMIEEADVVLDCSGTYSQPRSLGEGGIPALGETAARPHIAWGLEDILGERRSLYADKTTLVVGGGYSAATTVCNLTQLAEKHPATWVIWLTRGGGTQPIKRFVNDPFKERDRVAVRANMLATRGDGNVEFHPQTLVSAIECAGADKGFKVRTLSAGKTRTWEVDRLIANVGYSPDNTIYRELQFQECYASLGALEAASWCPEPNFFILGSKSFGRNASFFLRTGLEQVRDVFASLLANSELINRFPGLHHIRKRSA